MPLTTRAIVFEDVSKVTVRDVQLPDPTTDDIVVETEITGVSVGTERWALIGKRREIGFPCVPGYMGIGRITSAGDAALERGWEPGQLVNFFASRILPPHDRSWMAAHMATAVVDTRNTRDPGGFDAHRLEHVPDGCSPLGASLTGLCGVAMRGIEMAVVPAGVRVLVNGLGVIGQYAAQVCRLKGAQVCAADVDPLRLQIAGKLGAEWTINPASEDLRALTEEVTGSGWDIIIDTSSIDTVVNSLWPLLRMRGKFILQGWYPPPSQIDLNAAHSALPTVTIPSAHSGAAVFVAMQWVADGRLDTESLITHRARPEDAPEIYAMVESSSSPFLGIVFEWGSG